MVKIRKKRQKCRNQVLAKKKPKQIVINYISPFRYPAQLVHQVVKVHEAHQESASKVKLAFAVQRVRAETKDALATVALSAQKVHAVSKENHPKFQVKWVLKAHKAPKVTKAIEASVSKAVKVKLANKENKVFKVFKDEAIEDQKVSVVRRDLLARKVTPRFSGSKGFQVNQAMLVNKDRQVVKVHKVFVGLTVLQVSGFRVCWAGQGQKVVKVPVVQTVSAVNEAQVVGKVLQVRKVHKV